MHCRCPAFLLMLLAFVLFSEEMPAQTPSTGALAGSVTDPSGAVVEGVVIQLASQETGESISTTSDGQGAFNFIFLAPGSYQVQANKAGSASLVATAAVNVS